MTVSPYWELSFDADGEPHPVQLRRLLTQAAQEKITDLVLFAHGWNNDRHLATRLSGRFFAPFPKVTKAPKGARRRHLGYVGVLWPSMRFTDESIPDFDSGTVPAPRAPLDARMQRNVGAQFPGRARTVERIALLLEQQPDDDDRRAEFVRLVRHLTAVPAGGAAALSAADTADTADTADSADTAGAERDGDAATPVMLGDEDATATFEEFTAALREAGGEEAVPDGLWSGGRELLRQAAYRGLQRRAGAVGEHGLGPALARIAEDCPGTRLHLVGHGFGARLVSFALRGMPEGAPGPASVTLLQAALSHYAFADRLPHDKQLGGVLRGVRRRPTGTLVACYSSHDSALGRFHPLASRLSREDPPTDSRYGAMGYDGIQAVPSAKRLTLDEALDGPFPAKGVVSVDASRVVHRGGAPAGAHSDICHAELARVVAAAGRIGG